MKKKYKKKRQTTHSMNNIKSKIINWSYKYSLLAFGIGIMGYIFCIRIFLRPELGQTLNNSIHPISIIFVTYFLFLSIGGLVSIICSRFPKTDNAVTQLYLKVYKKYLKFLTLACYNSYQLIVKKVYGWGIVLQRLGETLNLITDYSHIISRIISIIVYKISFLLFSLALFTDYVFLHKIYFLYYISMLTLISLIIRIIILIEKIFADQNIEIIEEKILFVRYEWIEDRMRIHYNLKRRPNSEGYHEWSDDTLHEYHLLLVRIRQSERYFRNISEFPYDWVLEVIMYLLFIMTWGYKLSILFI